MTSLGSHRLKRNTKPKLFVSVTNQMKVKQALFCVITFYLLSFVSNTKIEYFA